MNGSLCRLDSSEANCWVRGDIKVLGEGLLHEDQYERESRWLLRDSFRCKRRFCCSYVQTSSIRLPLPPLINGSIILYSLVVTSLTHQAPSPRSYYAFHHPLIPYQRRQCLRSRISRKVSRTIRIKSLVHYSLPRPHILYLPQHMIRIVGIRRSSHARTVVQDIAPYLPARKEYLLFKLIA